MPIVTRHSFITVVVLAVISLLIVGVFIWSGLYNIGADDTHTKPVYAMLQTLRERSISARASELHLPPNLEDPALIRQGAGNYDSMCTGCHLGPGMEETELSKGLYPSPPNFTRTAIGDPSHHFWVIKHGIKASGMPAWGKSMKDEYMWGMVAFLQQLPRLDEAQYKTLVASSGGHSHGGGETGETGEHHHDEGAADDHHDEGEADHHHEEGEGADHDMAGMDMKTSESAVHEAAATQGETHVHADGTKHVHAPKASTTPAAKTPASQAPVEPTEPDPHAGMAMPETAPAEHTDDHDHH